MSLLSGLIALVAALSGLVVGYATGVIAGAEDPIATEFGLQQAPFLRGLVVGCILIGGFVGAIASGPLSSRIGQKPTLIATGLLFLACGLGMAVSDAAWQLILWRSGAGLAIGAATMVAPLYVGETAPAKWRGALITGFQLALTIGILLGYLANIAFADSGDWRMMLGLTALPGALLALGMLPLPESPRWLVLKGREVPARAVFHRIHGSHWADEEVAQILATRGSTARWAELLGPRVLPVMVIAAGLFAFTNLSGIDVILYYSPTIFETVGFSGTMGPILATAGIGAVNVAATVLAMWLVDRAGRRPLLLGGLVPMTLAMALMVPALASDDPVWHGVAVAALAVFIIAFAISLGPLPYVVMAEVFPARVRSLGMGIAAAMAWGVNAIVSVAFLPLAAAIGMSGVFALFAAICAIAFVFVWVLVPETRGRSLEEIEANLAAGKPVRRLGDVD
ncbi:sugar porter family MFS transporter [Marinibaculum pumilum]|uniref:Sugar porter family MFS transporter n=1 Tax=Marinibaculum pumilum TaxID=1766165 RepID=A0ABV7KUE1_9PROT